MNRLAALLLLVLGIAVSATATETRTFESDGNTLRYVTDGSGPTVILLHGFSGSANGLYVEPGTFEALVDAGFRVIALDQRGHGGSDKPVADDAYGLNMVEDVRRLIDQLSLDQVHLVGYSMGGKVANSFRAAYPDRLLSVTLGGYGWPWRSTQTSYASARERLDRRPVLPGNDLDALAAVSVGMYDLHVSEESLKNNQVPALAIIGDKDEVVSKEDFETLVATMANLQAKVIPGTHAGPDGAPYKPIFAEKLVSFLTSL